jgi:GTP cyclohydrolase I
MNLENAIRDFLINIDNSDSEIITNTPNRFVNALKEQLTGYDENPTDIILKSFFDSENKEMVIIKNVHFTSMCAHHLLPFIGKISIGYNPNGKVVGLSKIPRIVNIFAKRLQLQENLTKQVCDFLSSNLNSDVIVYCEAVHECVTCRGIRNDCTTITTFKTNNVSDDMEKIFLLKIK